MEVCGQLQTYLIPRGINSWYLLDRKVGGPGSDVEEKIPAPAGNLTSAVQLLTYHYTNRDVLHP